MSKKLLIIPLIAVVLIAAVVAAGVVKASSVEPSAVVEETQANNECTVVNVATAEDFQKISGPSIYLIEENYEKTPEFETALKIAIDNNMPIISVTGCDVFTSETLNIFYGYDLGDEYVGYYKDPISKATTCKSFVKDTDTNSVNELYDWADQCLNNTVFYHNDSSSSDDSWWDDLVSILQNPDAAEKTGSDNAFVEFRSVKYYNTGRGSFDVTSIYSPYKTMEKNTYYVAKYIVEVCPNNDIRTGEFTISTTGGDRSIYDDQRLINYIPSTCSGLTTVQVNLDYNVPGWSYSLSDTDIIDKSNLAEHGLEIKHDLDQNAAVGSNICVAKPGAIYSVENGHAFSTVDTFSVMFFKVVHYYSWSWLSDEKTYDTSISIHIPAP